MVTVQWVTALALMRHLLTALLCVLVLALTAPVMAGPPQKPTAPFQVGSELIAIRDVSLRSATLAKGSRVRVRHVARRGRTAVAVDLELKDGHVLRGIAIRIVQQNFKHARQR